MPRTVAVAFLCNYCLPHSDSRNDTDCYFLTEEKKKNGTRLVEVKKTEVHMVLSRRAGTESLSTLVYNLSVCSAQWLSTDSSHLHE